MQYTSVRGKNPPPKPKILLKTRGGEGYPDMAKSLHAAVCRLLLRMPLEQLRVLLYLVWVARRNIPLCEVGDPDYEAWLAGP